MFEFIRRAAWIGGALLLGCSHDGGGGLGQAGQALGPTCVTIQRGVAGGVADTYVRSDSAVAWGSASPINAGRIHKTGQPAQLRWTLLRWDLAPVPPEATIESATVTLVTTGNNGVVGSLDVRAAASAWTEATTTWASFGQAVAPTVEATFQNGGVYFVGPRSFDLTGLVTRWHGGETPNLGIAIVPHDGTASNTFFNSSEVANVAVRPKLEVCYSLPGGPAPDAAPPPEPDAAPPPEADAAPPLEWGDHPRLVVSAADLPRLRAWAAPGNPMWTALQTLKQATDHRVITLGRWHTDAPNIVTGYVCDKQTTYCDSGYTLTNDITEEYALFYAFLSLLDGDPAQRDLHAGIARRMLMYVVNQCAQGLVPDAGGQVPFCNTRFAWWNRGNWAGESWGLIVDWIYPYLTDADKAAIQKLFLLWSDVIVREGQALTTWAQLGRDLANLGDAGRLGARQNARHAWNNYNAGQVQHLVSLALSLDPEDDPPRPELGTLYPTVRGYLDYIDRGNWLQYHLFFGEGEGSGGIAAEGPFGYGVDTLRGLATSRLILKSSGHEPPAPQSGFADSPFWSRVADGLLASVVNRPRDTGGYAGQVYEVANFNQTTTDVVPELFAAPLAAMAAYEARRPDDPASVARHRKLLWMLTHLPPGGAARVYDRPSRTGNIYNGVGAWSSILHFLALDPAIDPQALPDPRPQLPTTFVDGGLGRVLSRTTWDESGRYFGSLCQYMTIDHQIESGHFFFARKGEWITRPRSGYSNSGNTDTAAYNNELAVQNVLPNDNPALIPAWFREPFLGGSPVPAAMGDPTFAAGARDAFVYAGCDLTPLYNLRQSFPSAVPSRADAVTHASRDIVWLKPDAVVVYDRATTSEPGLFKRFHLFLSPNDPQVGAGLLSGTTPGGQQYWVTTVLPANADQTLEDGMADSTESAYEPYTVTQNGVTRRGQVYTVRAAGDPADARFLHVVEGGDAGASRSSTALVRSDDGLFEGVEVGGTSVLFRRDPAPLPAGAAVAWDTSAAAHVVTGLAPNATYTVTLSAGRVVVTPGPGVAADAAGVLAIGL